MLAALVTGSGLALAGGWAVTSVDSAPDEVVAGTTYDVDYTIRQHGTHPVDVDGTFIRITSITTGEQLQFPGQPTGETGRYTAQVTFPAAGAWEWQVEQGMFGAQELGAIDARAPASDSIWTSSTLRLVLPVAAVVAIGLLATQTFRFRRDRRQDAVSLEPLPGPTSGD